MFDPRLLPNPYFRLSFTPNVENSIHLSPDSLPEDFGRGDFERAFSNYVRARGSYATTSGRAAIVVALRALGVSKRDEVIIPSIACGAVADAVLSLGAIPVLADCNGSEGTLEASRLDRILSRRTKAIIAVHYQGLPCDLEEVGEICNRRGIPLIEDCAHAIGSKFASRELGSFGDYAIYSFAPDKPMTTGHGGMLTSSSGDRIQAAENLRDSRENGRREELSLVRSLIEVLLTSNKNLYGLASMAYFPAERMASSLLPATLSVGPISKRAARVGAMQLKSIERIISKRVKNARRIREMVERNTNFRVPAVQGTKKEPVFLRYTVLANSPQARDKLVLALRRNGVDAGPINWRVPLHESPKYATSCKRSDSYDGAKMFSQRFINLPCHPYLDENDFRRIERALGNRD